MPSDAVVTLVVDATGAQAQIDADLNRIVNTAERNAPAVNINVVIDNSTNTLNQTINQLGDVSRGANDADGSTSRLGATFSRMGTAALSAVTSAARIGAIGSIAAAALPAVAGLGAALLNIAPAAAAGVTAFVGLKAATLTLKVGLTGVEDALSQVFATEPDAEALAAALERLAPEARSFVLEMQKLKPALDDIRLDVQNRLFQDLDAQLKETAETTLPILRRTALGFARDFNQVGKNVASSAQELGDDGSLVNALDSSSAAFTKLVRIPGQLLAAIVRVAAGGGPLLIRIADRVADVADALTDKLDKAAESGALKRAIDEAAAAIRQIGRIASNVFGAIGNILDIAADAGGGLFGSLEKVTQSLEDLTASDGFRDVLTALIETGQTLISNILPLLQRAFEILAPVITELAPPIQDLLDLIGTRLLETLDTLAPTFDILGEAVGNLITALSPIVDLFFTLLNALLPVLNPLLDALNEIIIALTPVIEELATQLAEALVPVIDALLPIVTDLADFIARVVVAIAPLIEEILPLVVGWFARWLTALTVVLEVLEPLIAAGLDFVAFLVEQLVPAIIDVIDWVKDMGAEYKKLVGEVLERVVIPALRAVRDFLNGDYSRAWDGAKRATLNAAVIISRVVSTMLEEIRTQFIRLGLRLPGMVATVMSGVADAFRSGGRDAVDAVQRMILDAIGRVLDSAGSFHRAGQRLMSALAAGVVSRIGSVVGAVADAAGRARDLLPFSPAKTGPFSGRGYPLYSGQAIMESLAEGITSRAGLVSTAMRSALTGSPLAAPSLIGTNGVPGSFGRAVTGALSATVGAPNVNVYLGNELLTDRMRVVVDNRLTDRDRQASQGVRY